MIDDTIFYLVLTAGFAAVAIGLYVSGNAYLRAKASEAIAFAELYSRKASGSLSAEERRVVATAAYARLPKVVRMVVSQEMFAGLIQQLFERLVNRVEN